MRDLFGRGGNTPGASLPFKLDASRLKEDERLELIYDQGGRLLTIQKVKLDLFHTHMEAQTTSEIPPGETGWVAFEGSYWKARSEEHERISAGSKVRVIARHACTLLVQSV